MIIGTDRRTFDSREADELTIWLGGRTMIPTSVGRIAVPALALVVVCGAAIIVVDVPYKTEPPVETKASTAVPAIALPTTSVGDEGSDARATPPASAVPPRSPASVGGTEPAFDAAVVGPAGDAVIAGRAEPGATVELLRNGKFHDRTVADQSGEFVIVTPRLPAGDSELTLRSRQPDGRQATSQQSVAVSVPQPNVKDQQSVAVSVPPPNVKDQQDVTPVTPDRANVFVPKPVVPCPPLATPRRLGSRRLASGRAPQSHLVRHSRPSSDSAICSGTATFTASPL